MDLTKLRAYEDRAVKVVETLPRIEQLIALRYLRTLLGVAIEDTQREIVKEFKKIEGG